MGPFDEKGLTAFVTGGCSGLGREFCKILFESGANVAVVDLSEDSGKEFVEELNSKSGGNKAIFIKANVASWEEQKAAFEQTVQTFGRIDYACPIAGITEFPHLPPRDAEPSKEYVKPDLKTVDVNFIGVVYTSSLGIQTFRRQELNRYGFKGKLICVASICGLYASPLIPMYTSSKHAVVGYVKSLGKFLPSENITMNAVCPHVVRSNLTKAKFDDILLKRNLYVPMESVQTALTTFLGKNDQSAEALEVSPEGKIVPWNEKPLLDDATTMVFKLLCGENPGLN